MDNLVCSARNASGYSWNNAASMVGSVRNISLYHVGLPLCACNDLQGRRTMRSTARGDLLFPRSRIEPLEHVVLPLASDEHME